MTTVNAAPSLGGALPAGLVGGIAAAAINIVLVFVFQSINGGPLLVARPGAAAPVPLLLGAVLLLSLGPGLVAGLVFWVRARFTARPRVILLGVAVVVFGLLFFGSVSAATGLTVWALETIHLGAALPIVWALMRRA